MQYLINSTVKMIQIAFYVTILLTVGSLECFGASTVMSKPAPHIVFIVADDLGYADIGYTNQFIPTPNINSLAQTGVLLNQSYVQPMCSPSRSAFMSGYYPFKTGLQHWVIKPEIPACMPLDKKLLPAYMTDLGYSTHIIGKWHLGYCNWNCTPTYRGFDSFFGYYNGYEDYFTHKRNNYLDFRRGTKPVTLADGIYNTNIFMSEARSIIFDHSDQNKTDPLFLYLPFQAVHNPIQVPQGYEKRCSQIKEKTRRVFCGMVAYLDDAVGNVTQALKITKMYENTILIFTTDNGGMHHESFGRGFNYPLRGEKGTIWEGGTRGVAFVHSPLLTKTGYTSNEMIHAVDWFSTIISLAGGSAPKEVDGLDQSDMILHGEKSTRTEFIYNLDNIHTEHETNGAAGIRMGDYKLLVGPVGNVRSDGWFVPPEYTQNGSNILAAGKRYGLSWDNKDTYCHKKSLFNIKDDPEERQDLSKTLPEVVKKLETRLKFYKHQMVPANYPPLDPKANPENFGGVWSPGWC